MNKTSNRRRLMASSFFGAAAVLSAAALPPALLVAPTAAFAQDYTSGALTGSVQDVSGAPVASASVAVRSVSQGFTRSATTNADGQFRFALLPAGDYQVTVTADGVPPYEDTVRVNAGAESGFTFTVGASDATSIDDIVVVGTRANLDFTQTTKGLTIDVEELSSRVPVARDATSISLLSPSVVTGTGSAAFQNLPSIGGSTVAENAYYVNGLNITNFDTYVGGATVPFDFYRTIETKTGGYPAEYGRATGGVVNAVTKSGTNDLMIALHGDFAPASLSSHSPDSDTYSIGYVPGAYTESSVEELTVEIGGPIIRDRLFAYGLYQARDVSDQYALDSTYTERESDDPFWGVKLDGYLAEGHHLEYTYFNTESTRTVSAYAFNRDTGAIGAAAPLSYNLRGGENYIAKYTGTLTDWLTISAAYGVSDTETSTVPEDTTSPRITDSRFQNDPTNPRSPFISSAQKVAGSNQQTAKREFYRVDADMYFDFLGEHHVRMGLDQENNTLNHVSDLNGGRIYNLRRGAGVDVGYGVPLGQDFVQVQYQRLGGLDIDSENKSYYIQDSWDVTDNFSLQLGLRYDDFLVQGLSEENSFDLSGNWGPRIGFTWDPFGNGDDKVYGNFGRYFVPPASNLAYRGADFGFSEYFLIPNGQAEGVVPTLGAQITAATNPTIADTYNIVACPEGGFGTAGVEGCTVTLGRGIAERAFSKTSQQLEATNEEELILGYTRRVDDSWTIGAALTYRRLNKVSEDITLDQFVVQYCEDNGYDVAACEARWDGSWQYVVINPGEDIDIYTRGALPGDANPTCFGAVAGTPELTNCGTLIHLTAEELGYEKPEREYLGLELNFERAWDGKWGLQGSYVLSKSEGNYEGTVLSDNGQADAGSTILFDYPGLADYQYGLLPNHRAHQFKIFGSYQLLDNLLIGANASIISPQKYSCLGVHPDDQGAANYGAAARFCAGTPAPRGSLIESDWIKKVDLTLSYTVPEMSWMPGELVLRASVFNLFNEKGITQLDEVYDEDGATPLPTYGAALAYQQPRYVRFGFDLQF
ncbi:TonB-dependent receptor domain-containing protein [Brevundimonas sp. NPDC092305]|uniref:TonB-dependent receptor n=1 Tax=Brevundimonas sp. NPDC092305 TaxID=3363957 RepID=UPI0038098364